MRDGLVPYDDEAKKVLGAMLRETLRLGHNYIGTEHILLALLEDQPDGALTSLGIDKDDVDESIAEQLQKLS